MKNKNYIFIVAAVWEILRFFLIFMVFTLKLNPSGDMSYTINILWIAAPALMMSAAFLAAGIYPSHYSSYINLLILGKITQLGTGIFYIAINLSPANILTEQQQYFYISLISAGIVIVDLLLGILLVLKKKRPELPETQESPEVELPRFKETKIGE